MRKLETHEIRRLSIEEFKHSPKTPLVLILDDIRSQHNIGSIFRTADAFRIEAIALCGITATPPGREIQKTALGATESVVWQYFPSALEAIGKYREMGYRIAALEQAEGSLEIEFCPFHDFKQWAIVVGNEVLGVDPQVVKACDTVIEIPQRGTKHSLNVAIATGILCWEFFRRTGYK